MVNGIGWVIVNNAGHSTSTTSGSSVSNEFVLTTSLVVFILCVVIGYVVYKRLNN